MARDRTMISNLRNILLIQLGDIGDVVLTTSSLRAVKENYPHARVSIMVRKPFGNLLLSDPNIYEVVESENYCGTLPRLLREYFAFARRLRQSRYDLAIDLRTGDRGAILTYLTGARIRVGLHESGKPFWYRHLFTNILFNPPYAKPPVHPGADQSLRILRNLGIETKNSVPKLYIAPNEHEHALLLLDECGLTPSSRCVTINPCSRWKYKEWSYDMWGELIDLLWSKHQFTTLLVGAPEDVTATESITKSRSSYAFNLAGRTTLGQLAALLSTVTAHLGVDSAASHIAAAVGTPTLTIFGPGNWRSWTVTDDLHRVVTSAMPCIPCNQKGCNDSGISHCINELKVDEVWKSTEELLESIAEHHREQSLLESLKNKKTMFVL
jgi:predicted lipopolysaccharide heptosyltransferase III